MTVIKFNPDTWASRVAGFPRIVASVYLDICLHNWRTGRSMALGHYSIVTADLGEQQAHGIADMLCSAGKIAQDEHGIWSPDAIEDWRKMSSARERMAAGGRKGSPVAKRDAALPVEPEQVAAPAAPVEGDDDAAKKAEAARLAAEERRVNIAQLAEQWNRMAVAGGLTKVTKMTDQRQKQAGKRIDEHGAEVLLAAIAAVPQSPFLTGHNDRGWKLSFDAFLQPSTCVKLIEGQYHNAADGGKPSGWR